MVYARSPGMELSFSKFRLRFYFFVGALICQLIASNIPAFDTSHLVSKPSSNSPDSTLLDFSRDSSATGYSVDFNDYPPNLVPSAGLRWDALHYIDVALSGAYTYEHQYAFSPGVPIVLRLIYLGKEQLYRLVSRMLLPGSKSTEFCSILTNLINALLVAMVASQPSLALYNLTERVTRSKEFSFLTLLVHVILGAPPVIIRSVYAEPFFAWFTFEG
ncbi:unnamed protein product [Rhizoctonia solani]|uniref:GPI mannosyltransferase 2 n=2 Tax=Rhizoctonia solani TaxID=456999 RepID=A0A8H2WVP4_9AGAM|nr:unnamed protein product [Rhizoctonia solani]